MNWNVILPRVVALAAAVGAGLTAFTGAFTANGDARAAAAVGLAAVVATWIHEEHSTERNATTAAASITPAPAPSAMDLTAAAQAATAALGLGAPAATPAQSAQPAHQP